MAFFSGWFTQKKADENAGETVEPAACEAVMLKPERFNLNDMLGDVANLLAQGALDKQISIVYLVDKNVPAMIIGDRYKLANILIELVGNAIDFTNRREDVAVRIRRNAQNSDSLELHFDIRDAGIGMSVEQLEEHVLPMLRSDQPAAQFGLATEGLQRARDTVHAMQGSITMVCRASEGCRVSFYVQLQVPDMKERRHYRLSNYAGVGRKTLVVDDDAGSANALKTMLEYFRHTVTLGDVNDFSDVRGYDIVMVASSFWDATAVLRQAETPTRLVMIENILQPRYGRETLPPDAVWRIEKPFTQQGVYEMLLALYGSTPENVDETAGGQAPEGVYRISRRVAAFLDGEAVPPAAEAQECLQARRLFAAEDGLQACQNNYDRFVDQLQEFIWKYVKADRMVGGMIDKGEREKAADYCREMQRCLQPLGLYRLACCCTLLAHACREGLLKDIAELNSAFGPLLVRTVAAIDRFVEEAKYKGGS